MTNGPFPGGYSSRGLLACILAVLLFAVPQRVSAQEGDEREGRGEDVGQEVDADGSETDAEEREAERGPWRRFEGRRFDWDGDRRERRIEGASSEPPTSDKATDPSGATAPQNTDGEAKKTDAGAEPAVWQSTAPGPAKDDAESNTPNQLQFDFSSASWRDVLEWFAGAAQMNLNWREMPEGELNLITRGTYSVEQAQDVLNMHLLARGFTLLERDGALFLVKLDESLNPTMVPRVDPAELDVRGNYEFVKVSLPLDWMLAEQAAKELAPILSPYGKIIPLTATNRIEAMDAVSNLRELRNMLQREQSDHSQDRLVAEFPLRHASAVEVVEKLNQLLGIEKPPSRMSRDQMRLAREQMVLRAEMVKRLGEQAPPLEQKSSDVHLVVNERQNSILANAPPDKIAIIRQAILALDVPPEDQGVRLTEVTTMRVYPLNGAEADAVVQILEDLREIGKLHPSARFSEDDDRQILFAYASLQDHLTIQSVMDQLAGTARSFQVVPLRHLKASYVADSIRALMQGVGDSRRQGRERRWGRQRDRGGGGGANGEWNGFRVEPDLPNNRLFLFATAAEMEQVEELLVKLGERSSLSHNQRIISVANDSLDETIERVRSLWPTMSSHPLRIEVPGHEPAAADSSQRETSDEPPTASETTEQQAEDAAKEPPARNARRAEPLKDAALPKTASDAVDAALAYHADQSTAELWADLGTQPPDLPPQFQKSERNGRLPVYIRKGPGGELILRSDDPEALDQLESLIWNSLPQTKPYAVFRLEHASPYSVQLTLEEIFAADDVRVSAPLKFVSDATTKSIMVFGAGVSELREIEELIEFYDQPLPVDPETAREPRFIQLEYARAETVAEIIKELYRDLLSPNDPALQQQRGDREGQSAFVPVRSGDGKQLQFKGMLSIGTFPDTNTMVVSAPQYLADEIEQTVRELDRDEAATVTTVVELNGLVNGAMLVEQLTNAISPGETQRSSAQQRQQSPDRRADQRRDRGRDGGDARTRSNREPTRWRENWNRQNGGQGRGGLQNGQRSGTFRSNRNPGGRR